jgi:hypothetical protein
MQKPQFRDAFDKPEVRHLVRHSPVTLPPSASPWGWDASQQGRGWRGCLAGTGRSRFGQDGVERRREHPTRSRSSGLWALS